MGGLGDATVSGGFLAELIRLAGRCKSHSEMENT
jgi:hypothetical protein